MFPEVDIVGQTFRLIEPFCNSELDTIIKEHPTLGQTIQHQFKDINKKFLLGRDAFFRSAIQEANDMNLDLASKQEVESIFSQPLYVRNHMLCLTLVATLNGKRLDFPLRILSRMMPDAFFSPKKTPSMIMITENTFCSVIVTYRGRINFVGGGTEEEVQYALIRFVSLIETAMHKIYPGCSLTTMNIVLHNRAVTTGLSCRRIDVFNLIDLTWKLRVPSSYVPEYHDVLRIIPLRKTAPSIHVFVFPSGGIFCAGLRAHHEIPVVAIIVASIIKNFIRFDEKFNYDGGLKDWTAELYKSWEKQEKNKIRRRERLRAAWNRQLTNDLKKELEEEGKTFNTDKDALSQLLLSIPTLTDPLTPSSMTGLRVASPTLKKKRTKPPYRSRGRSSAVSRG